MCDVGASKTQIVYNCNLNFHHVVPHLELLIKNGLVVRVDEAVVRYQTTPRGADALWHLRELEELIAKFRDAAEEMPAG